MGQLVPKVLFKCCVYICSRMESHRPVLQAGDPWRPRLSAAALCLCRDSRICGPQGGAGGAGGQLGPTSSVMSGAPTASGWLVHVRNSQVSTHRAAGRCPQHGGRGGSGPFPGGGPTGSHLEVVCALRPQKAEPTAAGATSEEGLIFFQIKVRPVRVSV